MKRWGKRENRVVKFMTKKKSNEQNKLTKVICYLFLQIHAYIGVEQTCYLGAGSCQRGRGLGSWVKKTKGSKKQ